MKRLKLSEIQALYREKLKSPEWLKKRQEILVRDKFTCQYCNNNMYFLNYRFGLATTFVRNGTNFILVYTNPKKTLEFEYNGLIKDEVYKILFEENNGKLLIKARSPVDDNDYSEYFFKISSGEFDPTDESEKKLHTWQRFYGLQVHHIFYLRGLQPWEYANDLLTTLCDYCHKYIHRSENERVFIDRLIARLAQSDNDNSGPLGLNQD